MNKLITVLSLSLSFISLNVEANWICNVANNKSQHWTFSAPTLGGAESMAKSVCDTNSINPENCTPDCYDNGFTKGRWHCVVTNKKGEHWSYFAPNQLEAQSLAKNSCNANSINPENCNPTCIPE